MSGKRERKKRERERKVSDNNGQLCLQPPPWVANASRLDKQKDISYYEPISSKVFILLAGEVCLDYKMFREPKSFQLKEGKFYKITFLLINTYPLNSFLVLR